MDAAWPERKTEGQKRGKRKTMVKSSWRSEVLLDCLRRAKALMKRDRRARFIESVLKTIKQLMECKLEVKHLLILALLAWEFWPYMQKFMEYKVEVKYLLMLALLAWIFWPDKKNVYNPALLLGSDVEKSELSVSEDSAGTGDYYDSDQDGSVSASEGGYDMEPSYASDYTEKDQATLTVFKTESATTKRYKKFLFNLRNRMAEDEAEAHGAKVLVLPSRSSFTTKTKAKKRWHTVQLIASPEESVDLILDRVDAYIIGYCAVDDKFHHLKLEGHQESVLQYVGTNKKAEALKLGTNYCDLVQTAGFGSKGIASVDLGIFQLQKAIRTLKNTGMDDKKALAEALLVCIQMVSEAARFSFIEEEVCKTIIEQEIEYTSFKAGDIMLELVNKWAKLSTAAQSIVQKPSMIAKIPEDLLNYLGYLALAKREDDDSNAAGTSQHRSGGSGTGKFSSQSTKNNKGKVAGRKR